MRVLVTGRSGQVANSLVEAAGKYPDIDLVAVGRPRLDLADRASVFACIAEARPDVVVSAAAYTAVDRAEDDPDRAYAINVQGAAAVAAAARAVAAPVIHLSTDYVFSGAANRPYEEGDRTGPRTVYGLSKLDGEKAVALANAQHVIVRTSWVYSPFATNFVKTMLRLAARQEAIRVVADQYGNPTSALDIADGVLEIARHLHGGGEGGLYHFAGSGGTNWADFARHIFQVSLENGGPHADVVDIATADYPARARRPLNSRLCSEKAARTFGLRAPAWQSSARRVVRRLVLESLDA